MNDIFSRAFGLFFGIVLLPVTAGITVWLLSSQGRPIFYKGERLGKNGKVFTIYKFRTLAVAAESKLQGQVVSTTSDLKTPIGRFLRVSRLDELPQLWNLARGDISLFGPRPIRESIYATMGNSPYYYKRLLVKPGLFGPTQVLLTHGAPKRMRFLFFKLFYSGKQLRRKQCALFFATITALIRKSFLLMKDVAVMYRKTNKLHDRRNDFRKKGNGACVYTIDTHGKKTYLGSIKDANGTAVCITTSKNIKEKKQIPGVIAVYFSKKKRTCWRFASCSFHIVKQPIEQNNKELILSYTPASEFNKYLIDKYLLKKTIC